MRVKNTAQPARSREFDREGWPELSKVDYDVLVRLPCGGVSSVEVENVWDGGFFNALAPLEIDYGISYPHTVGGSPFDSRYILQQQGFDDPWEISTANPRSGSYHLRRQPTSVPLTVGAIYVGNTVLSESVSSAEGWITAFPTFEGEEWLFSFYLASDGLTTTIQTPEVQMYVHAIDENGVSSVAASLTQSAMPAEGGYRLYQVGGFSPPGASYLTGEISVHVNPAEGEYPYTLDVDEISFVTMSEASSPGSGYAIAGPYWFGRAFEKPPFFSWSASAGGVTEDEVRQDRPFMTVGVAEWLTDDNGMYLGAMIWVQLGIPPDPPGCT